MLICIRSRVCDARDFGEKYTARFLKEEKNDVGESREDVRSLRFHANV